MSRNRKKGFLAWLGLFPCIVIIASLHRISCGIVIIHLTIAKHRDVIFISSVGYDFRSHQLHHLLQVLGGKDVEIENLCKSVKSVGHKKKLPQIPQIYTDSLSLTLYINEKLFFIKLMPHLPHSHLTH